MNFPLKRRKFKVESLRESAMIRSAGHLTFVRGFVCSVSNTHGHECQGKIEAAHVRIGTDGGTALKPSDCWAIPLCASHHAEQHRIGERSFETKYKISMKAIAEKLWRVSSHRLKYERKQERTA
jgi:hypothetical protein